MIIATDTVENMIKLDVSSDTIVGNMIIDVKLELKLVVRIILKKKENSLIGHSEPVDIL